MTVRPRSRLLRHAVGLIVSIAAIATIGVVGAPAAQASTCATPGHAYVTKPGVAYFSGYDGDQRFGIPTFNTVRGDTFMVGGNGIAPYTFVRFRARDLATGALVDFFGPGTAEFGYTTAYNNGNCVANEEGPLTITVANGRYRVFADYLAGNLNQFVTDQVVDVVVSDPAPPPPPRPPRPPVGGCLSICTL